MVLVVNSEPLDNCLKTYSNFITENLQDHTVARFITRILQPAPQSQFIPPRARYLTVHSCSKPTYPGRFAELDRRLVPRVLGGHLLLTLRQNVVRAENLNAILC